MLSMRKDVAVTWITKYTYKTESSLQHTKETGDLHFYSADLILWSTIQQLIKLVFFKQAPNHNLKHFFKDGISDTSQVEDEDLHWQILTGLLALGILFHPFGKE